MARPLDIEHIGGLKGIRQSVTTKLLLLLIIFLAVMILLFWQFQVEDRAKNRILQTSLVGQGQTIAVALTPLLQESGLRDPREIENYLAQMRQEGVRIKLLLRPPNAASEGPIYYIASAPPPDNPGHVQDDINDMVDKGILQWMQSSCEIQDRTTQRFKNRAGQIELITSVTPIPLANGCWAVMTSHDDETLLSSSLGRETWRTPAVQIAMAIYILMAGLVIWLALDIWTNIQRFRKAAERIRHEPDGVSFSQLNKIPELRGAAREFDRLVQALAFSRQMIRQAADENAHALKTPLATISQAIEPIRRTLSPEDTRAIRSLSLIEKSVNRLDSLVSSARDLEQAAADTFNPVAVELDLSSMVSNWINRYRDTLAVRHIEIHAEISPGLRVKATEDGLETIFENLIENAASFTPSDSRIEVAVYRRGKFVEFSVSDQGPGIDPQHINDIFERYFSHRPADQSGPMGSAGRMPHHGLGLWIVRRYVESFNGEVMAGNNPTGGFKITIRLPQAQKT